MIKNIKKWFNYKHIDSNIKVSAGVILILRSHKLLLCHPTNQSWDGTLSFPKGGINDGETAVEAALRELREETSIVISKNRINNIENPIIIDYKNKKGRKFKKVYFFTAHIDDISEVGLDSETLSQEQLQLEEVDWCGFLTKQQATEKIFHRVSHLLDLVN